MIVPYRVKRRFARMLPRLKMLSHEERLGRIFGSCRQGFFMRGDKGDCRDLIDLYKIADLDRINKRNLFCLTKGLKAWGELINSN